MALVEFRDGSREVPDHLADLMARIDTYKITFEQARKIADQQMVSDLLNKYQSDVISAHFKTQRNR